jgi:uncharacterized protein YggU (UPF0235/DUF167 family)
MTWLRVIAKPQFRARVLKSIDLSYLTEIDKPFEVVVTPKASRNRIKLDGTDIRVYVTTVPEDGKATAAVIKLLSKAIGVPKSRLTLVRGATSRRKTFQIEG